MRYSIQNRMVFNTSAKRILPLEININLLAPNTLIVSYFEKNDF